MFQPTVQSNSQLSGLQPETSEVWQESSQKPEKMDHTSKENSDTAESLSGVKKCSGVMGVPITYLVQRCKDQFEVLDSRDFAKSAKQRNKETLLVKDADSAIKGKPCYARILIRRKQEKIYESSNL